MSRRHETIGLKQAIRMEWLQRTADLLLAGLDEKTIRNELTMDITDKRATGSIEKRSDESRNQIIGILMKTWVTIDAELIPFRDASLGYLREHPNLALGIHWCMISAAYPFWFSIARQIGRILALQDKVTQNQIISRIKEQYGDRETVIRYTRFVIRSFIAWGVLKDSDAKGCYEKSTPMVIDDFHLSILMFESALLTHPEAKSALGLISNNPGFFPFKLPPITGDFLSQNSERIDVVRYGLDDELLKIKGIAN